MSLDLEGEVGSHLSKLFGARECSDKCSIQSCDQYKIFTMLDDLKICFSEDWSMDKRLPTACTVKYMYML